MIDQAVEELVRLVGVKAACRAVGRPRSCHYRWHRTSPPPPKPERVATPQPRALSEVERKEVLGVLHDPAAAAGARGGRAPGGGGGPPRPGPRR